jgi:hypothetical protein
MEEVAQRPVSTAPSCLLGHCTSLIRKPTAHFMDPFRPAATNTDVIQPDMLSVQLLELTDGLVVARATAAIQVRLLHQYRIKNGPKPNVANGFAGIGTIGVTLSEFGEQWVQSGADQLITQVSQFGEAAQDIALSV